MSVKVLQRRTRLGPSAGISMLPNLNPDPPVSYAPVPSIFQRIDALFPHRKSPDLTPLSFADRVREFIHFKKPNIDLSAITPILEKLKVPGLVLAGVAFVAGIAYLAYKLYTNWSAKKAEETVNKIMADLESTAPELMAIDGWRDKIRAEVVSAVNSGEEGMVTTIANIKTDIIEKQKSMGAKVGAGIDLFGGRRKKRTGAGAMAQLTYR